MTLEPVELRARLVRAERAYERGRALRAAIVALSVASISVLVACLGGRVHTALVLGAGLLVFSWFCLWRGQTLGRTVFPGVVAGVVPLALALAAQSYGHVCTASGCMSLCVPACAVGGGIAGFVVARASRFVEAKVTFIAAASGLTMLVGSLGCSCVGYGGVVGLGLGLVGTLVPSALVLRRA
ncbi:MAG: hypothetical protein U0174_26130 [Polyangiaceae bacterium]